MRETYLQALRGSLETSGGKITPPVQRELLHLFESLEGHNEDTIRSENTFYSQFMLKQQGNMLGVLPVAVLELCLNGCLQTKQSRSSVIGFWATIPLHLTGL